MAANDQAYLAALRQHAADTRILLSNAQKSERERMVVRAYLRCLGIPFADDEIVASTDEPVDVLFRSAQFQIRDIVGNRLRGKEWAAREQRYQAAKSISDVVDPYAASTAIPLDQAAKMVADALVGKARHYAPASIGTLDALIYFDHKNSRLWPLEPGPPSAVTDALNRQGWRSVSMLFLPRGAVLTASSNAPEFLNNRAGLILNEWSGLDDWFEPK